MSPMLRTAFFSVSAAVVLCLSVTAIVLAANRQPVLVTAPLATTSTSTAPPEIQTNGSATVSKKPDLAIVSAGVQSDQPTAVAAQSDLAGKAAKLIARIKALGVADADLATVGYWIGPNYSPSAETVTSYRAQEQLQVKWHDVNTAGKVLDAIVQEGGATNISVQFTLNDPKSAQAEARTLAIGEARSKAQAMASAAGVKLGSVQLVSDLGTYGRVPQPYAFSGAAASAPTQVPVGVVDVEVTVEVDYSIAT